ncbi:MAG: RidA family protein [bacterium]
MEIVTTNAAPRAIGPYSQAVKAGGFLFLSGQIPLDPATGEIVAGDVRTQARQVFANLRAVLSAAGLDPAAIVKTTIFLTDMADFGAVNELYAELVGDHRPARSTVAVAALPRGARIEVEAIAIGA